jgi:hypothetical protein
MNTTSFNSIPNSWGDEPFADEIDDFEVPENVKILSDLTVIKKEDESFSISCTKDGGATAPSVKPKKFVRPVKTVKPVKTDADGQTSKGKKKFVPKPVKSDANGKPLKGEKKFTPKKPARNGSNSFEFADGKRYTKFDISGFVKAVPFKVEAGENVANIMFIESPNKYDITAQRGSFVNSVTLGGSGIFKSVSSNGLETFLCVPTMEGCPGNVIRIEIVQGTKIYYNLHPVDCITGVETLIESSRLPAEVKPVPEIEVKQLPAEVDPVPAEVKPESRILLKGVFPNQLLRADKNYAFVKNVPTLNFKDKIITFVLSEDRCALTVSVIGCSYAFHIGDNIGRLVFTNELAAEIAAAITNGRDTFKTFPISNMFVQLVHVLGLIEGVTASIELQCQQ